MREPFFQMLEAATLDETRGTVAGHQVIVELAKRWTCLNCGDRCRMLLAAQP